MSGIDPRPRTTTTNDRDTTNDRTVWRTGRCEAIRPASERASIPWLGLAGSFDVSAVDPLAEAGGRTGVAWREAATLPVSLRGRCAAGATRHVGAPAVG